MEDTGGGGMNVTENKRTLEDTGVKVRENNAQGRAKI